VLCTLVKSLAWHNIKKCLNDVTLHIIILFICYCRSLGFVDGKALCCGKLTNGYQNYWGGSISSVNCTGTESSFQDCPYSSVQYYGRCSAGLASAACLPYSKDDSRVNGRFTFWLSYCHYFTPLYWM
jgi:hypothetical protein